MTTDAALQPARGRVSLRGAMAWAALGLTLLLPLFLLHVRAGADAAISGVAALFLLRSAWDRDWAWLRRPWVAAALALWGWTLACTVLAAAADGGAKPAIQAALVIRFLAFAAALEHWVLRDGRARSWLLASLSAAAAWVAGSCILQLLTGRNLAGYPRWGDGELTGPFRGPRAAPTLVRILFPTMLPAAAWLEHRGRRWAAAALVAAGVAVVVLIGQRMPVLLTGLGLLVAGLLLPRIRGMAAAAILAAAILVGATAVVSPPAFYRLVTKFSHQVATFPDSPYGQITARAVEMARQHPWAGLGFNAFQRHCPDPEYQHGWRWPADPTDDGGGAGMCVTHPHSFYLQALTDAGLPGLIAFTVLVALWLWRLGQGLWRQPDPLRAGLFIAVLIQAWPLASTSPMVSLPMGGWFFLMLGFGLAAAGPGTADSAPQRPVSPKPAPHGSESPRSAIAQFATNQSATGQSATGQSATGQSAPNEATPS